MVSILCTDETVTASYFRGKATMPCVGYNCKMGVTDQRYIMQSYFSIFRKIIIKINKNNKK
jgi:hypothetical protein